MANVADGSCKGQTRVGSNEVFKVEEPVFDKMSVQGDLPRHEVHHQPVHE